jgi:hypothetical protein
MLMSRGYDGRRVIQHEHAFTPESWTERKK